MLLLEICKCDNKFFDLFRHISLEYCTPHIIDEIYNFSVENSFESILLQIYKDTLKHYHSNIRNKIELANNSESSFEKPIAKPKFEISNPSNSYVFLLASKEIKMEYSSSTRCCGKLTDINTYTTHDDFHTQNSENSWIRADLKGYKLKPNSYILLSTYSDSRLLRYWRLEGIKEDGSTVVLDNKDYAFKTMETKKFPLQTNNYFVAFKIIHTGKNQTGSYEINVQVFDFKGELIKI
ncbi:hypothetical protein TVAG_446860 [Trichomonas vaginalis G3]|uniref:SUN domain-containing protein n=1 Tax=Trichomonas vaginalis (strain ATCC PRA-98 / G3) TaxID=412133 RepID=A2E8P5_TRIV3|nr:protein ubiquitination [Trichomonas vaginalis G3]EAY10984.1 hypothetical protein TVAG_446860 [Trichomonas vaginalis G3]KAI5530815.1 protein ubiquitination [Trichomonas vaginalis G3]|eukprot:XP_001323207.1 hypothetical protein [Trichomonas vaginalis G3]